LKSNTVGVVEDPLLLLQSICMEANLTANIVLIKLNTSLVVTKIYKEVLQRKVIAINRRSDFE
jgi:hypothetical protein